MANYTTSADLLDEALDRVGEKPSGSDFNDSAVTFLNRVYQWIWMGGGAIVPDMNETWWWLRATTPGILTLEPFIETGTISVTLSSTSVTFSSAPTKSLADWFLKIDGTREVYRISSHTANAAGATLDGQYNYETAATASYKVFKLKYDLGSNNLLRLFAPLRTFRSQHSALHSGRINGIGLPQLDLDWPIRDTSAGVPVNFAVVSESDGTLTIRFSHYVSDLTRVEYDYLKLPSDLADDTGVPVVPRQYRGILADGVTWQLKLIKGDSTAQDDLALLQAGLKSMQTENIQHIADFGTDLYGWILPNRTNQFLRGRLRTASGGILR